MVAVRWCRIVSLLLMVGLATGLPATSAAESTCGPTSTAVECLCKGGKPWKGESPALLPEVRDAAIRVRRTLCVGAASPQEVMASLIEFVESQDHWFDRFGGFKSDTKPTRQILDVIQREGGQEAPTLSGSLSGNLMVGEVEFVPRSMHQCSEEAGGKPCEDVLSEFQELYTYAHTTHAAPSALEFTNWTSGLSQQWNDYFKSARGQTPLELLLNGYLYRRNESAQFSAPPRLQWIVLHPSIVVENVSDAVDGEETRSGLFVEAFGVNRWREDRWYVPSGLSLGTVYSDRPGVEDWGYAAALHFRSVYTLGYTNHDGSDGFFVSFDFLKLLQDKNKILNEYRP